MKRTGSKAIKNEWDARKNSNAFPNRAIVACLAIFESGIINQEGITEVEVRANASKQ